jgi:hypothetical protein
VKPAADRLKTITLVCAALWVASCVGLKASYALKPRFNEYDPQVLERVRSDEDFAAAAARASGGRPTYCDNRYYRAVANGGQGNSHCVPGRTSWKAIRMPCVVSHNDPFASLPHASGCN